MARNYLSSGQKKAADPQRKALAEADEVCIPGVPVLQIKAKKKQKKIFRRSAPALRRFIHISLVGR